MGQVPDCESECETDKLPSTVQLSLMAGLPVKASMPATVVAAAGAELAEHPSTLVVVMLPVIVGIVVSSILMVCSMVLEFPQASVIV